jgi:uncharacterized membrane protein YeiH
MLTAAQEIRPHFQLVLGILQVIGLAAYAAAGVIAARRKGLDLVGAIAIAFLTAFGGGSLRDLLLGRAPVFWVRYSSTAVEVLVVAALTFYLVRIPVADQEIIGSAADQTSVPTRRLFQSTIGLLDALGLGVFAVSGAAYSLQSGTTYFIASLMAVVTGVFGGVLRDVILNEIPVVFQQRTELYATCAFAGVWVYLGLHSLGIPDAFALTVGAATISALRLLALRFHWRLPNPRR